jgi:hypothetical protein
MTQMLIAVNGADSGGREILRTPALWSSSMFNFSANHLLLLSRMEYRGCVVFLMQGHSNRRVCRLYDFTKSHEITSDH